MTAGIAEEFGRFWSRLSSGQISSSLHTWGPYPDQDVMLERARAFSLAQKTDDWQARVAAQAASLRHFEIEAIDKVVAICAAGRSGSVLLASYFDGHEDVILMPNLLSQKIYPFFERYASLSMRDKLIAFPFFQTHEVDNFLDFFGGDFPIGAPDYYAAVDALIDLYADRPLEALESRRSFFLFLHVLYSVAQGRLPAGSRPLIVYAQHMLDAELAARFMQDFPKGFFIQTVRDPITNSRRLFEQNARQRGVLAPWFVLSYLSFAGAPHPGTEARTRIIRFEDLHLQLSEIMCGLADWLGLRHDPALLSSTFHDRPYVWKSGKNVWSGQRPEATVRDCSNTTLTDRWLFFALLNEDFVAWGYPCPRIFHHPLIRILACCLIVWIPTKMEMLSARNLLKQSSAKSLGKLAKGAARLLFCRLGVIALTASELIRRVAFGKKVLQATTAGTTLVPRCQ